MATIRVVLVALCVLCGCCCCGRADFETRFEQRYTAKTGMRCAKDCLVLLNVLVHPLDHRTRSLFRSTVCPFLPEGMDLVFITSQQVAANYSVALAAENATFGDMVFVDAERDHAEHDFPVKTLRMLTWWAVLGNRYAWYAHADGDTLVVPVFLRHRLLSLSTTHMVYCRGRGSGCGGPLFAVSADVAAEFPSLNKTLTGQGDPPNDIMFSDMIRDLNSSVCYALGDDEIITTEHPRFNQYKPTHWSHALTGRTLAVHLVKDTEEWFRVYQDLPISLERWFHCDAVGYAGACAELRPLVAPETFKCRMTTG